MYILVLLIVMLYAVRIIRDVLHVCRAKCVFMYSALRANNIDVAYVLVLLL